eukprot:1049651-Amphidinium_carterae.1
MRCAKRQVEIRLLGENEAYPTLDSSERYELKVVRQLRGSFAGKKWHSHGPQNLTERKRSQSDDGRQVRPHMYSRDKPSKAWSLSRRWPKACSFCLHEQKGSHNNSLRNQNIKDDLQHVESGTRQSNECGLHTTRSKHPTFSPEN